jgi:hypothetical protein
VPVGPDGQCDLRQFLENVVQYVLKFRNWREVNGHEPSPFRQSDGHVLKLDQGVRDILAKHGYYLAHRW